MNLEQAEPYIRYVNNYGGKYKYVQPKRILYDYEFMYVMDGTVTIYYGGKRYVLHKSDLFYFRPNVENYMVLDGKSELKTHCIHFDWIRPHPDENFAAEDFYCSPVLKPEHIERIPLLMKRYSPAPDDFEIPNYIRNLPYEKMAELFSDCYYSFSLTSSAARLRLRADFLNIISEINRLYGDDGSAVYMHPIVRKTIEYIKDHYTESICAEQLAERFGMSPKYFGTIFKKSTGKSISAFINDLRIFDAKQMLTGTDMTVESISEQLGFSNPFYFSKRFKEAAGLSPRQYRNNA